MYRHHPQLSPCRTHCYYLHHSDAACCNRLQHPARSSQPLHHAATKLLSERLFQHLFETGAHLPYPTLDTDDCSALQSKRVIVWRPGAGADLWAWMYVYAYVYVRAYVGVARCIYRNPHGYLCFPLFFKFAFSRLFWQKKKWLMHWYIVMSSWRTWNCWDATFPGNGCASLKRDGCPLHSRASWSHVPAVVRWVLL